MTVSEKRRLLAKLLPRLLDFIYERGDECEINEVVRTQAQAQANAASGAGIANSLHLLGLAVDLLMFVEGEYSTKLEDYRAAGEFWKTLDPLCCWGGDFSKPDADHFSITHGGVK
jgi:hypothetical protein